MQTYIEALIAEGYIEGPRLEVQLNNPVATPDTDDLEEPHPDRYAFVVIGLPKPMEAHEFPMLLATYGGPVVDMWDQGGMYIAFVPYVFSEGDLTVTMELVPGVQDEAEFYSLIETTKHNRILTTELLIADGRMNWADLETLFQGKNVHVVGRKGLDNQGGDCWAEEIFCYFRDAPHARYHLRWGFSAHKDSWVHDTKRVSLHLSNARLAVDMRDQRVLTEHQAMASTGFNHSLTFDRGDGFVVQSGYLGWGQSGGITGSLILLPLDPFNTPLGTALTMSTAAQEDMLPTSGVIRGLKRWGPHERVAGFPPGIAQQAKDWHTEGMTAVQLSKGRDRNQGHVRNTTEGALPNPGGTGDQPCFMLSPYADIIQSGNPHRIPQLLSDALCECWRSMWIREPDGSAFEYERHPEVQLWGGEPNVRVAGDHLGFSSGHERPYNSQRRTIGDWPKGGQPLKAYDWEHFSIVHLCAAALMSGDPLLVRQCHELVETWLGTFQMEGANARVIDPRGIGRPQQSGAWLWLVTRDERLKERLLDRTQLMLDTAWTWSESDDMLVSAVHDAHPTNLNQKHWYPWQESMLAMANEGILKLFPAETAVMTNNNDMELSELHLKHLRTIVNYGWDEPGHQIGKAAAWHDGRGDEFPIHGGVRSSFNAYSGYNIWGVSALQIAVAKLPPASDDWKRAAALLRPFRNRHQVGDAIFTKGWLACGAGVEFLA